MDFLRAGHGNLKARLVRVDVCLQPSEARVKPKMLAGIVLILIGAITILTGGIRSALNNPSSLAGTNQAVQRGSGLSTVREVLTAVCLLGGTGLVIASVLKK